MDKRTIQKPKPAVIRCVNEKGQVKWMPEHLVKGPDGQKYLLQNGLELAEIGESPLKATRPEVPQATTETATPPAHLNEGKEPVGKSSELTPYTKAVDKLKTLTSEADVLEFTTGETRASVLKSADDHLKKLTDGGE